MAEDRKRIRTMDEYREALGEVRRLRAQDLDSDENERLARLEAATAEFSERLRGTDLKKGRPKTGSE